MSSSFFPDSGLDARFCDLLVGWDELEQSLDAPTLIDQNMIGWKTKTTYDRREDVRRDLERLRSDYIRDDSYGRQIDRLIFYVSDIMSPHHVQMPERIEKMVGVKFCPFSDEIIAKSRKRVIERAEAVGLTFDSQLGTAAREADPTITDEHLLPTVHAIYEDGIKQFHARTGLVTEPTYSFELVSTTAGWDAYSSGELDHFVIRVNKDRPVNLRRERMAALIRHELLGHATYHTTNLQRIQAGELPHSAGLILLPCADLLADEGCAEISISLYCNTPLGLLNEAMMDYDKLCQAQAIHMQWRESREKAVEHYMDLVPYGQIDLLNTKLTMVSEDLFWRYYMWSYPAARTFFREAHDVMQEKDFNLLLRDCYTTPRDVPDLAALACAHGMSADQVHQSLRPVVGFDTDVDSPECQRSVTTRKPSYAGRTTEI